MARKIGLAIGAIIGIVLVLLFLALVPAILGTYILRYQYIGSYWKTVGLFVLMWSEVLLLYWSFYWAVKFIRYLWED